MVQLEDETNIAIAYPRQVVVCQLGQGVALGCEFVVRDDLAAGRLVQPFAVTCQLDYSYHLVFPDSKANKKVAHFYRWLLAQCEQ